MIKSVSHRIVTPKDSGCAFLSQRPQEGANLNICKQGIVLLAVALTSLASSTFASTARPGDQGYKLADSRQTFVLTPGSHLYTEWAAWIKRHDAEQKRADGATWGGGEVGQILITATIPARKMDSASVDDNDIGAPVDSGPPSPFPTKGRLGQMITIVNHTSAFYQRWTYRWSDGVDGNRAWAGVSFSGHACESNHDAGKLCDIVD